MSDNLRRYYAIHTARMQLYPGRPQGHVACHLPTLAMLISGLVGSRKTSRQSKDAPIGHCHSHARPRQAPAPHPAF